MPSLIDLRRRIRSVKNTQQITKAMKMVSAAKLRRAQEKVLAARPYSSVLREMMASILGNEPEDSPALAHPLLARRKEDHILVLLLTGDKGLCGAFNSNVIRRSQRFLAERSSAEVEMELIGRKGRDFYRRRNVSIAGEWINIFNNIDFPTCRKISDNVISRFTRREVDAVYLIFNEFKSVMRQTLIVDRLLPVQVDTAEGGGSFEYLYEQPAPEIFRTLLPRYVDVAVYQAMIESAAAEHAARMTAMDAATRNAEEMIDKLTLHMNRVRQASITNEIIEVVSGAAGLE
jgi:F-type H+-transporting ATPase subunit gamma